MMLARDVESLFLDQAGAVLGGPTARRSGVEVVS